MDAPDVGDETSVATLHWTNAGHPAPSLIHADGAALILDDSTDIILGVDPASPRHDHTHPVPPGATLLLYTDGLIETRSQAPDRGQQRLLDTVLTDMIDTNPDDDIAVLAVRFGDQPLTAIAPAAD